MNDAELAQLEHDNMITTLTSGLANAPNSLVERADGVATLLTGLPIRLFNQVLVDNERATDDAVARAVAAARARGDRFVVDLRVGQDDAFIPLMARLGLVPMSETPWMPGMAMYPISNVGLETNGHEIVRVTDAAGLEENIQTTAAGFEMPESYLRVVVTPQLLELPGVAVYTGYVDGQPVTSGLGFITGRTVGVYNISTVPEARRHGYGEQMTRRISDDGVAAGCDVAILQASDMGRPIYERIGYRTVVEYMGYIEPSGASDE